MTLRRAALAGVLLAALGACASTADRPRATATARAAEPERAAPEPSASLPAWETVGRSVRGRPIEAVTIGGGLRRVLLVGGIHGDEPEGGRTVAAAASYLHALAPDATVRIVRDVNPDGTAARSRTNSRGVDLNRNWPARSFAPGSGRGPSPLSEPETLALHDELERFAPDLVLVCHASHRGPFVNFDGPAARFAGAFASGAGATDPRWRVVPDMGYPTPGSLGSFLGVDRGVPILTLEFDRGHDPDLAWAAMRDGLGAVLAESGALAGR